MNLGRPEALEASYADLRVAVVTSRFNGEVTRALQQGAVEELGRVGLGPDRVSVLEVPGAFELAPTARRVALSGQCDAVVCLGAVVRGGTDHYEYVCQAVTSGLTRLAQDAAVWGRNGVVITFGVLTTATLQQALDRAGGREGNKGAEAARAALETAGLWAALGPLPQR